MVCFSTGDDLVPFAVSLKHTYPALFKEVGNIIFSYITSPGDLI